MRKTKKVLRLRFELVWRGKNTVKRILRDIATVGFASAISTGGGTWM